jgi:para-aminobenzoate synthetase component I
LNKQIADFPLAETQVKEIKQRMLNWSNRFSILLFLDSNEYPSLHGRYECLLGVTDNQGDFLNSLEAIQHYHDNHKDWLLGHITYDYKNVLEPKLESRHPQRTAFPQLQFFCPRIVCYINKECRTLTIESVTIDPKEVYHQIMECAVTMQNQLPKLQFTKRIDQPTYINTVQTIRKHIEDGDCYEMNFCNEGFCEYALIDPLSVFNALNHLSPAPFASYYRLGDKYMMSASPERYIYKKGQTILSQPIKGTARRDSDPLKDELIKTELKTNIKERAENVMIVDLVRNDLARCCEVGSVQVDELFGIYSFPQVHQMISTVSGKLSGNSHLTDAIRYSFPMGSMTGAPKMMVMKLIDLYEQSRRELFSGTVGYINPEGDFDLNVIIRSLFYNQSSQYLSYQTGGAITYDSVPQMEWEEMRLKAWALERIFS